MNKFVGIGIALVMLLATVASVSADALPKSVAENRARIAQARAAWLAEVDDARMNNYIPSSYFSALASSRGETKPRWAKGLTYVGEGKSGCSRSKPYAWCWRRVWGA